MNKPRYKHHCGTCKYLGLLGRYDLYFCPSPHPTRSAETQREPCLVVRTRADDLADMEPLGYCSGFIAKSNWADRDTDGYPLTAAYALAIKLARRQGFIAKDEADCALTGKS